MEENKVLEENIETIEATEVNNQEESSIEKAKESAKWYVLHTYSGYENVAKENLEIVIDKYSLQERVFDIIIPMEDVVEEKKGKREVVSRKLMPGYIVVKMIYGDDIWHAVTRTQYVNSFVGPKGRPVCITDEEARVMGLDKVGVETEAKFNLEVKVGDMVEIIDGSLASFVGTVKSVDEDAQRLVCMVEMFGRESEVELGFNQVRIANS